MEIIIDECIAKSTILILKEAGFKIINVEDILEPGVEDELIFEYASNHKIPIITHDRGFGIFHKFSQHLTTNFRKMRIIDSPFLVDLPDCQITVRIYLESTSVELFSYFQYSTVGGQKLSIPARLTGVLKKEGNEWLIAQRHISVPASEN